jgi:two-component system LytT family response regulator
MPKIRTIVVDDEPLARRGVRDLLAEQADIEVIAEAPDGLEAVRAIEAHEPDLVFLDVQMPGLDGFEVLEHLETGRVPAVVFVTAHDAHALRAFDVHAVDYLLKPLDPDRFRIALERARTLVRSRPGGGTDPALAAMLQAVRAERKHAERLLVRGAGAIEVVPVTDLDWIEADGDYVRLHTAGKEHLLRERLHALERRLDPEQFVRTHRSYLVRIDRIRQLKLDEDGDGSVVLTGGELLPFSRTHRERLLQALREPGTTA